MMTNVMVKTWIEQKIIKIRIWFRQWRIAFVRQRIWRFHFRMWITNDMIVNWSIPKAEFVRIYRMFRSVDWTHDMIIVKWHLFFWHERKLCALTNAPPVQSTQTGSMTINIIPCLLFCRSGLCLALWAIHICSKLQATTILAGITIHWALRKIFSKIFCVSNDDKCYGENMNWTEKLSKIRIWFRQWRIAYVRPRMLSEGRFFRSFRIVDSTNDMIIVKWHLLNFTKAEFVRIFTECSEVWIEHTTW